MVSWPYTYCCFASILSERRFFFAKHNRDAGFACSRPRFCAAAYIIKEHGYFSLFKLLYLELHKGGVRRLYNYRIWLMLLQKLSQIGFRETSSSKRKGKITKLKKKRAKSPLAFTMRARTPNSLVVMLDCKYPSVLLMILEKWNHIV